MSITLTFGDVAENNVGMQKIGEISNSGYNIEDIMKAKEKFENAGYETELINLHEYLPEELYTEDLNAYFLIVRNGINYLLHENNTVDDLFNEQNNLEHDKKYYHSKKNKVLNKIARHNLCFSDYSQEPDYENGKGRIINYDDVPITKYLRESISLAFPNSNNLNCEANYYYNDKTGIGPHGDGERMKVIGCKLGKKIDFKFFWFKPLKLKNKTISILACEPINIDLNHGDLYIMSEKAVGNDWLKRSKITLRHAAGCKKYTEYKNKF